MSNPKAETQLTIGQCATLACVWEATAAKPGNVYRGADFEDLTYVDFLTSAAIIGPILEQVAGRGLGKTILAGVEATQAAVNTNTNLGILLLFAPLAAQQSPGAEDLKRVLAGLTVEDTHAVYQAIRLANPGGLGEASVADVRDDEPPTVALAEAMRLAADRDLVARQYINQFAEVRWLADQLAEAIGAGAPLNEAIVDAYLQLLCREPDSLIARKNGVAIAEKVCTRANAVQELAQQAPEAYRAALADFDFYLRSDDHRLNPGTTADLVAAALFVLLRDRRIPLPVSFYASTPAL